MKQVYIGDILFTKTKDKFNVFDSGYLCVENGIIFSCSDKLPVEFKNTEVLDYTGKLIIPSFVDLHLHAPQYLNRGVGTDLELLQWLEKYTFPEEIKFSDIIYSRQIWKLLINSLWECGSLRSVVFSSRHYAATRELILLFLESKLSAHIGKVVMDINAPDNYIDDSKQTIEETLKLIEEFYAKDNLVDVILTPRFVPTCSPYVMSKLGDICQETHISVQSHLNESLAEIAWVKELHPEAENYSSVYEKYNLFGNPKTQSKSIMAHCIHNTEAEINLMKKNNFYPVHCPESNANLISGVMDVKRFLEEEIPVSFGSDISGGNNLFIPKQIILAIQLSKIKARFDNDLSRVLTTSEAFFMATKNGGSYFGKVGSFENGYSADFLVIDQSEIMAAHEKRNTIESLEKWLYIGSSANIKARYLHGNKIEKPFN